MSTRRLPFANSGKSSYTFLRVVTKLTEIDRMTRCYGTDTSLYHAEIHMIKSIRENEGIHVTGLAELLGVTKGAVSQIIQKLERKGMIVKDADPNNLSRLVLHLTPKGETAYRQHEELHREFDGLFNAALENATEENRTFLRDFMNMLDEKIDAYMEAQNQ